MFLNVLIMWRTCILGEYNNTRVIHECESCTNPDHNPNLTLTLTSRFVHDYSCTITHVLLYSPKMQVRRVPNGERP